MLDISGGTSNFINATMARGSQVGAEAARKRSQMGAMGQALGNVAGAGLDQQKEQAAFKALQKIGKEQYGIDIPDGSDFETTKQMILEGHRQKAEKDRQAAQFTHADTMQNNLLQEQGRRAGFGVDSQGRPGMGPYDPKNDPGFMEAQATTKAQHDYEKEQQGTEDSQYRDLTAPALGPTGPLPNLIGMHDLGMTGPTKQTINTRAHAEGGPVYGEGAMSRALRDYGQEPKPRAALDPAETQLKLAQAEEARARATSLGTPKTDPNAALKTQELQARVDEIKARAEKMKRGDGAVKWDTPTTRRYELLKAQADQLLANYQTDDAMAKYKEASDFIDAHGGGAGGETPEQTFLKGLPPDKQAKFLAMTPEQRAAVMADPRSQGVGPGR